MALALGSLLLGWHLFLGLWPRAAGRWLLAFPRQVWAGRILAALALGGVVLVIWHAQIAWLDQHRWLFCALAPLAYILVLVFVDELLAVRALGGIFLLVPAPLLAAAFVHQAPSRLLMTIFAYGLAGLGMVLVWSPYLFRKMVVPWIGRPALCRGVAVLGASLGALMLLLGWLVYR